MRWKKFGNVGQEELMRERSLGRWARGADEGEEED